MCDSGLWGIRIWWGLRLSWDQWVWSAQWCWIKWWLHLAPSFHWQELEVWPLSGVCLLHCRVLSSSPVVLWGNSTLCNVPSLNFLLESKEKHCILGLDRIGCHFNLILAATLPCSHLTGEKSLESSQIQFRERKRQRSHLCQLFQADYSLWWRKMWFCWCT